MATIQQPRYPAETWFSATVGAFAYPWKVSTIDLAPSISRYVRFPPTVASCAVSCCRLFGTYSVVISPAEVESPIYTTERHDVRVGSGLRAATVVVFGWTDVSARTWCT